MCLPLRIFSPTQPRRTKMRHSQDEHLLAAAHFRYSLTHHF
jgi:hypothetical protein